MSIDWQIPTPRQGLKGAFDKFIGPGTTPAEVWLEFIPALLAGAAVPAWAITQELGWHPLQLIVAAWLGFDLTGGIITNAASPAKRWYHRPGQGFRQQFGFTAIHIVYLLLIAWLFRNNDWSFAIVTSGYLLIAAAIILKAPLYLQRPIAFLLYALAILLGLYAFSPTPGMEWFLPFFYLKLLVSYLVREEPYRPDTAQQTS
jgi:hypothetical protein